MTRFAMNDFQPLTLAEKQLRLEEKIVAAENNREPLIQRKREIELELSQYANMIKGKTLVNGQYSEIYRKQDALKVEKVRIEKDLAQYKSVSRQLHSEVDNIKLQMKRIPDEKAKQVMLELRDKYLAFAADTTRVSSMRAMASKFVEEIQSVLSNMN